MNINAFHKPYEIDTNKSQLQQKKSRVFFSLKELQKPTGF